MLSPECYFGKIPIAFSVAGLIEQKNKLLLVQEADGYGPPAGHLEDYEYYSPKSGLFWELAEETNISPTFKMNLWGAMIHFSRRAIQIGLVYRLNEVRMRNVPLTDPDILSCDFFSKDEIRQLLQDKRIRKSKWNEPLLSAWLKDQTFLFRLFLI